MLNLKKIRKDLHKIPEIGMNEWKTQSYILEIIEKYPMLKTKTFDFPGIIAEYNFADSDEFILFRADMDALPIAENNRIDFASMHNGKMHACGHDVHMTILLGLIDRVVSKKLKKNIIFLFQPAEEGLGGAERILKTGYLDNFKIKEAYALHVTGFLPVGSISCKPGIIFGIPQEFDIKIFGNSAHAAYPHNGNDALLAAMNYYQQMKAALKENFAPTDPVIFNIGKVEAGTVRNSIPDLATMEGTLRIFSKENHLKIKDLMLQVASGMEKIHNVKIKTEFLGYYDPVINSQDLYEKLADRIPKKYNLENVEAKLVGEDFGYFTTKYKGLLFWLGTGVEEGLHSSRFLPKEECIEVGVDIFYSFI